MSANANRVAVMHGVNLDQLGGRDPLFYGNFTLAELEDQVRGWAGGFGLEVSFFQTNFEGAFVEHLHSLRGTADAAILNPGSWTHYAWAIRDALELVGLPTVEIHISDISQREEWRRHSVLDGLVIAQISGEGAEGYREALELISAQLGEAD